jgi:tetratricopeptide (TPR) repeat protein
MSRTGGKPSKAHPKTQAPRITAAGQQSIVDLAIWLGLILATLAVYAQVGRFDFVNYDDDLYVYDNVQVKTGLTPGNVKWAFTAVVASNWMPVTLLSHIVDVQFFGLQSGMHHLVNVLLHALSAVLLFVVLQRATRARRASAFVAFVFALHPLHVESVAWISERKDVLSAFFFFLTLYCYVRYTERPCLGRYLLVLGPFFLGLMSKPMLVTLPFTLLLFDIWPLRRVPWPKILWEKVPLFALSAGASVVTWFVQRETGAFDRATPLATRIENALISYVTYIGQTFWPVRLSVFYPYPKSIAVWQAAAAFAVILGVSALAIFAWRKRPPVAPYLITGWFWYLGTLVPVIGLVQVGQQAHADRYTYIPMVGLLVILAWGAADVAGKWPRTRPAIAAAAAVSCVLWMAVAWTQTAYWRNSEALFQLALDVTGDNWVADNHLGQCLTEKGRNAEAIPYFEAALRIKDSARDNFNLGLALSKIPGRSADAVPHFEAALRFGAESADTENDLGACLMNIGRDADAISRFEAALRVKPDFAEAHFNLALALAKAPGRTAEAIAHFEAGLRLSPDHTAHSNFAVLLMKLGRTDEAIPHFEAAVRMHPDYRNQRDLGTVLSTIPGRQSEAIAYLEAAQRIHSDPEVSRIIDGLRSRP